MNESDLAHIVWRAPEWINALGGLRPDNVLEYFAQSPFFDRRSNNAVLKMQSQFQSFGDVNEALKKMRGTEFVVASQSPPDLFVINKQQRESYDDGIYFVANGNIYLAPDAHSIITSRMLNVNESLKSMITELTSAVQYDPSTGYTYDVSPKSDTKKPKPESDEISDTTLNQVEINSMHKALFNTIHQG